MADRSLALTTVKGGINRLRTKGAALNDSLYDLLNGYVTASKTVVIRPGSVRVATLPTDTSGDSITKGLVSFEGALHVFASEVVEVPAGYVLHVLVNPRADGSVDSAGDPDILSEIHFAAPFMGFLYVVAEFGDGSIYHFWLQSQGTWAADTVYADGDIVVPIVPNGLAYKAKRLTAPLPSWAANVPRALNDQIEPTVYNGYYYTVVDVQGANPASGATEPTWPTEDGQQVSENTEGEASSATAITTPPTDVTSTETQDRYGSPYTPGSYEG